jgi:predicted transposase YdaD
VWFVAEAEKLPTRLMKAYISEERLMESELYQSIFSKGEARGEARGRVEGEARGLALGVARGEAQTRIATILQILTRRLGSLDPALRERIQAVSDNRAVLSTWYDLALDVVDAEGAQRLVDIIQRALLR